MKVSEIMSSDINKIFIFEIIFFVVFLLTMTDVNPEKSLRTDGSTLEL